MGTINGNFHQLYSVTNLDLRALDTSELTSMSSMFSGCISLKSLDLSSFNTSSADNAAYMFYNCQSLESLDISGFDLSGINKMSMMFFAAGDYAPALRIRCSYATKKAIISTGASCNPSRTIWDLTDGGYELYRSTDFSMDGQVRQLQKATRGAGINLIIMGDAFSDRLINDGRYDYFISQAVDTFFDTEPYSSLRDMFNVFEVYAVSDNEEYGNSSTAFQCVFDAGRTISGNLSKIEEYASKAVGTADFDDIVIAVVLNARIRAGCACFFVPSNVKYGCGDGLSIAYIPINESDSDFKDTFRHEVCGHAFAKLADEYVEYTGTYPDYMKKALATYEKYGWSKNIDITSDKTAVKWTRFLFDSRYAPQGLGVFEGAGYYHYGVWRSTESSIMKDNSAGYFNAPSREAIYIRANKLAFGSGWEYDYETFVEQDLRTYWKSKQSSATRSMNLPERHTAQPIVVEKRY